MWQNLVAPSYWESLPLPQQHRQCPTSMPLTLLESRNMEKRCQPLKCVAVDAHLGVSVLPRQWEMLGKSQALTNLAWLFSGFTISTVSWIFFLSYSIAVSIILERPGIKCKIPSEAQHIFLIWLHPTAVVSCCVLGINIFICLLYSYNSVSVGRYYSYRFSWRNKL